ncbi:MAG: hypothetical protein HRF46_15535 [Acidobacteriota bacterium]
MRIGRLGAVVILLAGILSPCEAAIPACPDGGKGRGATVEAASRQVAVGHVHSHPHRAAPHHHHAAVGTVTPRLAPPVDVVMAPADLPPDPRNPETLPAARALPSRQDSALPLHILLCTLLS